MLVSFSVSNFLSFNHKETFSMAAGKARKHSDRIYRDKRTKLTKCEVVFGANASGKSNLISAFQFVHDMVLDGLPHGFSNKYFKLISENRDLPSLFSIDILLDEKIYSYSFSILLSTGSLLHESLYEKGLGSAQKLLFDRDTKAEKFSVGPYFRHSETLAKLNNYGEDSANDQETLFLTIINKNKGKMFADFPELQILRDLFEWFSTRLYISFPGSILTGYPYFTNSNLSEIAELLGALGTGISELKVVELPTEVVKSKMPTDLYNKIIADLEKANARTPAGKESPKIMARSYKEFFTFEISPENNITITTIEFSHENKNVFFELSEESDGTARLLDLIEMLFKISDNRIFIIDEIDRCLHPAMTVKIVDLFLELAKTRNTQLIITSHESRLLASEILRNDEICFVSRNDLGATIIDPLEKYQLRADKKVYTALFDGTLKFLPQFNEKKLTGLIGN